MASAAAAAGAGEGKRRQVPAMFGDASRSTRGGGACYWCHEDRSGDKEWGDGCGNGDGEDRKSRVVKLAKRLVYIGASWTFPRDDVVYGGGYAFAYIAMRSPVREFDLVDACNKSELCSDKRTGDVLTGARALYNTISTPPEIPCCQCPNKKLDTFIKNGDREVQGLIATGRQFILDAFKVLDGAVEATPDQFAGPWALQQHRDAVAKTAHRVVMFPEGSSVPMWFICHVPPELLMQFADEPYLLTLVPAIKTLAASVPLTWERHTPEMVWQWTFEDAHSSYMSGTTEQLILALLKRGADKRRLRFTNEAMATAILNVHDAQPMTDDIKRVANAEFVACMKKFSPRLMARLMPFVSDETLNHKSMLYGSTLTSAITPLHSAILSCDEALAGLLIERARDDGSGVCIDQEAMLHSMMCVDLCNTRHRMQTPQDAVIRGCVNVPHMTSDLRQDAMNRINWRLAGARDRQKTYRVLAPRIIHDTVVDMPRELCVLVMQYVVTKNDYTKLPKLDQRVLAVNKTSPPQWCVGFYAGPMDFGHGVFNSFDIPILGSPFSEVVPVSNERAKWLLDRRRVINASNRSVLEWLHEPVQQDSSDSVDDDNNERAPKRQRIELCARREVWRQDCTHEPRTLCVACQGCTAHCVCHQCARCGVWVYDDEKKNHGKCSTCCQRTTHEEENEDDDGDEDDEDDDDDDEDNGECDECKAPVKYCECGEDE